MIEIKTVPTERTADLAARQVVAAALAAALRDPMAYADRSAPVFPEAIVEPAWSLVADSACGTRADELGFAETAPVRADAAPLARWLARPARDRVEPFKRAFGMVVSRECPPYETEYCESRDAFHRAQQMADIAGFYRAFGLQPDAARPERADHVALALSYVAQLLERLLRLRSAPLPTPQDLQHEEICRAALASFVRDHVAWWMPVFGRRLQARAERLAAAETDPDTARALRELAGVGRFLRAWVAAERLAAGVEAARRISAGPSVLDDEPADDDCGPACGACTSAADAPAA